MNKTRQPTWTNGEFSTRGWKRRVNRTRYFAAWNNNEAGWPQCVCNACSVISRPPDADHLSLSFPPCFVLLAAVCAPRKSRKSRSVICILPSIDGNRRRSSRFSFCLPFEACNAWCTGQGLAGWSESENWNLFHNCSFQNYNSCKDYKDLTLTKRWQKSWLRFIYLFIYFSLSKLSWVRRLLFFGLKYNFLKFSVFPETQSSPRFLPEDLDFFEWIIWKSLTFYEYRLKRGMRIREFFIKIFTNGLFRG